MRIHKEGYPIVVISLLLSSIISQMSYLYLNKYLFVLLLIVCIFVCGIVLFFFRNPVKREVMKNSTGVIAPADGTIVAIEKVEETEFFKGERLQVSIFMSLYNVHKNFFPIDGTIEYYKHHSGNFHRAILPKSSCENERSTIVVKGENGKQVLFRQVAGAMARRVVSYVEVGQLVEQSSEAGFIKFGSRVDLYLPIDADIKVALGDKTTGSRTLLATI